MKNRKIIFMLLGIAVIAVVGTFIIKGAVPSAENTPDPTTSEVFSVSQTEKAETLPSQTHPETATQAQTTQENTLCPTTEAAEEEKPLFALGFPWFGKKNKVENFSDCAFIGNSRFVSVKDSGLAENVYPVVGLDVRTVFTKHVTEDSPVVIDELNGRDFDKVVLMFGDNECGWPNVDYFIKKYSEVIDAVRERAPHAEIYLHAVIPISESASEKNVCGCNNETIAMLNGRIKQLAKDSGAEFIEPPSELLDCRGNLLDEAASDGVHLNRKYTEIWLGYLEKVLY